MTLSRYLTSSVSVLILAGILIVPTASLHAQDAGANNATTAEQSLQTPAGKFVQDLGNQAIVIISNKGLTADQRAQKYNALLSEAFDIPTIGKFVLGRYWAAATPDKQQEYLGLFKQLIIKIYGDRLNFYNGEKFVVKSVRQESEKDIIVNSEIQHGSGGAPTTVAWRLRQQDGGKLMIIDVNVEGVSQSVTQRQEYGSILERNNGNIEPLLTMMRQQIAGNAPAQAQ